MTRRNSWRRRLVTFVLGLSIIAVPVGLGAAGAAAQAVVGQGLSGTLAAEGVGPVRGAINITPVDPTIKLSGADYTLSPCLYAQCQFWETDDQGHFAVALPDGDYWVRFAVGGDTPYADVWWGGTASRQGSTKVTVSAGQVTQNVDQVLPLAGSISGTIAQAASGHGGDADGIVTAWVADTTFPDGKYPVGVGTTPDDGTYTVGGLPSSSYHLQFTTRTTKFEGWWKDKDSFASSTPVDLVAPGAVNAIDPILEPFGSFAGKITRAVDGSALKGVAVDVFAELSPGQWVQSSDWTTSSAADGTYSLKAGWFVQGRAFPRSPVLQPGPDRIPLDGSRGSTWRFAQVPVQPCDDNYARHLDRLSDRFPDRVPGPDLDP